MENSSRLRSRRSWLVIFGLLASAALWLLLAEELSPKPLRPAAGSRASDQSNASEQSRERFADLERQVAQLNRSLLDLNAKVQTPPAAAPAPEATEPKRLPPETEQEVSARYQAQVVLLDDRIGSEAEDRRWAPEAQISLHRAYQGEEFAGGKVVAECKTTLCRVQFEYQPGSAFGESGVSLLSVRVPWDALGFMKHDVRSNRGTFYVAREGQRLPQVSRENEAQESAKASL